MCGQIFYSSWLILSDHLFDISAEHFLVNCVGPEPFTEEDVRLGGAQQVRKYIQHMLHGLKDYISLDIELFRKENENGECIFGNYIFSFTIIELK